jgi:hypothetical protein
MDHVGLQGTTVRRFMTVCLINNFRDILLMLNHLIFVASKPQCSEENPRLHYSEY